MESADQFRISEENVWPDVRLLSYQADDMKRRLPQQEDVKRAALEEEESHLNYCVNVAPLRIGSTACSYLKSSVGVISPSETPLDEFVFACNKFPVQLPVHTVRCSDILLNVEGVTKTLLEHNVNSAYPILHEAAFYLYVNYLEHKKKYGSGMEKVVYANMGVVDLVQRFLDKRAVSFFGKKDTYLLLNGKKGHGGWEQVGKDYSKEKPPLVLVNCLSYDEMKLSALLSVSSHSVFINDGNRQNRGNPATSPDNLRRFGVIIGLIGARLARPEFMEWQEIVVSKEQNVMNKGYGPDGLEPKTISQQNLTRWRKLWASFYGLTSNLPTYEEVEESVTASNERYFILPGDIGFFDNDVYKKRIGLSIETLLMEAESRAAEKDTTAYIHVVGIGLGVWKVSEHQEKIFLDAFADCLVRLNLPRISDVNFSWFKEKHCGGVSSGGVLNTENGVKVKVIFSKRPPHERLLLPEDEGKLLVVSYAWDGNALPGNEFWMGKLSSTGDSAAACSTQIAELHNPHINKTQVSGNNLHIATTQWGVLHVADYARKKLSELTN